METTLYGIALILSAISFIFSLYTFFWTAQRDKKLATLNAYTTLQNEVLDKLVLFTLSDIEEIANDSDSREYKELSVYVYQIEQFCTALYLDIYDKETVYKLAQGFLDSDSIKERFEAIIKRETPRRNHRQVSRFFTIFRWMRNRGKHSPFSPQIGYK